MTQKPLGQIAFEALHTKYHPDISDEDNVHVWNSLSQKSRDGYGIIAAAVIGAAIQSIGEMQGKYDERTKDAKSFEVQMMCEAMSIGCTNIVAALEARRDGK